MLAAVFWLDLGPRAHTVCLADIFSSAPADDNFGLDAQYFQRFCQDCHKCKCESWRLIVVLWFDVLIFVIKADLRSRADLARRQGDSNMYIRGRRFGPSYPCCAMTCLLKGKSVYVNIEGLSYGFLLRYQSLLTDSSWLQDALLGVALLLGQLRTAAAWIELKTWILQLLGNWDQLYACASWRTLFGLSFDMLSTIFRIKLDSRGHIVYHDGIICRRMCFSIFLINWRPSRGPIGFLRPFFKANHPVFP